MSCLDENELAALLEHRTAEAELARIDEHLAACTACRHLVAELGRPGTTALALAETEASLRSEHGGLGLLVLALARAHAESRVGSMLANKWTLERVLGVGGVAQVFAATHRNGKRVAIKLLRPELCADPSIVVRFLKEAYAANSVGHRGVVSVLDDGVAPDGAAFLVMDLLEGETLAERLARAKRFDVGEVIHVTDAILDVLGAAHDKGIVHRDIKPENVFVEDAGAIRLLDFGIARLRETARDRSGTEAGAILGTPSYMPPEQARGRWDEVDAKSDLWAVGATMYTLLTGHPVRRAGTLHEQLLAAMTEPVPPIRRALPALDVHLARVIDKALALDRAQRFSSGEEMRAALRAAVARAGRRRRVGAWPALAVVAAVVVGAYGARGTPSRTAQAQVRVRAKEHRAGPELALATELAHVAPAPSRGAPVPSRGVSAPAFASGTPPLPEVPDAGAVSPAAAVASSVSWSSAPRSGPGFLEKRH